MATMMERVLPELQYPVLCTVVNWNKSSPVHLRVRCATCNDAIYLRYDCEPHTDGIFANTISRDFDITSRSQPLEHIHAKTDGRHVYDGQVSSTSWGTWTPAPTVCMHCFQIQVGEVCAACEWWRIVRLLLHVWLERTKAGNCRITKGCFHVPRAGRYKPAGILDTCIRATGTTITVQHYSLFIQIQHVTRDL